VVERDRQAIQTLRDNRPTADWPLHAGDVRELDFKSVVDKIDILAAGVPCQPFSQAGMHAGPADDRNMFPETFEAIRALRPKAVLIENVRGLMRPTFLPFVEYIVDHLRRPHLALKIGESWPEHHARLRAAIAVGADVGERYCVEWHPICAADYGVAQRRVRVLMVAVLDGFAGAWEWPTPTHSLDILRRDQLDGYYWAEHGLTPRSPLVHRATRIRALTIQRPSPLRRWRTLRDVLAGLPDPSEHGTSPGLAGHELWPGARLYRGHRGTELDGASKTIKAGVHGVAGGEHIVHLDDGTFRYLTVRECMRIQDLPDSLIINAPRTSAMRQIGNAVPARIGEIFGRALVNAVCKPREMPRAEQTRRQDEAAGGYLLRQVALNGHRVTASIRLQKGYAYLYYNRKAGSPLYLGKLVEGSEEEQLAAAWAVAHAKHPELFLALTTAS
jgi:DNA (cytosine-5)-methyltransferase 1